MIQKLFIMNGYFYGFSRFLEAKAKMALQNFHEYYCFIQNKFIMTHISVNQSPIQAVSQSISYSISHFIHPLCQVVGIGHVNNLLYMVSGLHI